MSRDGRRDELRRLLDEPYDPALELNENEQWLGRHHAAVAALVPDHAELYRALLARREAEGLTPDVRASALDAAGTIAAVMQSLRRRPLVVAAASEAPVSHTFPLGTLDHLFYSFTLLTSPVADDHSMAMLELDELDELVELSQPWLAEMGGADTAGGAET